MRRVHPLNHTCLETAVGGIIVQGGSVLALVAFMEIVAAKTLSRCVARERKKKPLSAKKLK